MAEVSFSKIASPVDFTTLKYLINPADTNSSHAVATQLVNLFRKNATDAIFQLKSINVKENLDLPKKLVHRLKGSSAMIGANQMANFCQMFETELLEENISTERFEELINGLIQESHYVLGEFDAFLSRAN